MPVLSWKQSQELKHYKVECKEWTELCSLCSVKSNFPHTLLTHSGGSTPHTAMEPPTLQHSLFTSSSQHKSNIEQARGRAKHDWWGLCDWSVHILAWAWLTVTLLAARWLHWQPWSKQDDAALMEHLSNVVIMISYRTGLHLTALLKHFIVKEHKTVLYDKVSDL